jgi:hypothetical protein
VVIGSESDESKEAADYITFAWGLASGACGCRINGTPYLESALTGGRWYKFERYESTRLQAAQSGECEPIVMVSGELQRVADLKLAREWTAMQECQDGRFMVCEGLSCGGAVHGVGWLN